MRSLGECLQYFGCAGNIKVSALIVSLIFFLVEPLIFVTPAVFTVVMDAFSKYVKLNEAAYTNRDMQID